MKTQEHHVILAWERVRDNFLKLQRTAIAGRGSKVSGNLCMPGQLAEGSWLRVQQVWKSSGCLHLCGFPRRSRCSCLLEMQVHIRLQSNIWILSLP